MYINMRNTGIWPRFSHGLFWFVVLLNIWAINAQNDIVDLITKPLLIPLLLLYYISNKKNSSEYFLSQFISWMGSLFFIAEMPETTIAGMICFWAALLLYIYVIIQYLEIPFFKGLNQLKRAIPLLIYFIYFIFIMLLLGPNLKGWFSTITAYALTITFLSFIATIHCLEQPTNKFRRYFLIGILLLFLDASIICYQFFNQDNTIISLSVRVIFILAHYFICLYFTFDHRLKNIN